MNYKEKYKEALERAKKELDTCGSQDCNAARQIFRLFPELAESDGEKVRKEIINYFRCQSEEEPTRKEIHNKWIAWLEKQEGCEHIKKDWLEHIKQSWYKEGFIDGKYSNKTPKEWTINDTTTLNELIDFLENGTAKLQHDLTRYANWLKIQFTPIERQGEQEKDILEDAILDGNEDGLIAETIRYKNKKQGEKHPDPYNGISFEYNGHIWGMCARDNGVDISCDKHLIKHLEEQGEKLPVEFYYVNSDGKKFYSDTFKYGDVILHVEKQGEQKSQRTISAEAKEALFDYENANIKQKDFAPNGEQKPEENKGNIGGIPPTWSDEDERHKNTIIRAIHGAGNITPIDGELAEDWLKSLRPQSRWKPSEGDIIILEKVFKGELEPKVFQATLQGILEQLKKL